MSIKIKGIIFDMDNTILKSGIDFNALKNEIFDYLVSCRVLRNDFPAEAHTTSTLIEYALRNQLISQQTLEEVWNISKKHEVTGMKEADLESGVVELLNKLQSKYILVILTNNSYSAALSALEKNRVIQYFDRIIGREQINFMKPAPDGVNYILNLYKHLSQDEWLSVGDAWIDGKASQDAGVKFVSYKGDINKMNCKGVYPIGNIKTISEISKYIT